MRSASLSESEISQQLKQFICTELMNRPSYPLEDDEPLISGGLIDSFCLAQIGVFIELRFGVYISDTDLTVASMDTVNLIIARVLQR